MSTGTTASAGTRGDRDHVGMPAIIGTGTGPGVASSVCYHGYGNGAAASAASGNADAGSAVKSGPSS